MTVQSPFVADQPGQLPPAALMEALNELRSAIRAMTRAIENKARPVDEYRSNNLAGDSELTFKIQPQFERLWVLIDHILITGPIAGTLGQTYEATAAAPASNGNVLLVGAGTLLPGDYTVNWKVGLDGTVTEANDANNMKLVGPPAGGLLTTATFPGAVGQYPQEPYELTIPQGNANSLSVKAAGNAATAGSIYSAQMTLTPNGGTPVQLQLGDRVFTLYIPATGVLEMSPKKLMLAPWHDRIFTAQFAGEYTVELTGEADVRNQP